MATRVRVSCPALVRRRWLNRGSVGVKEVGKSDCRNYCKRHRDNCQKVSQCKPKLVIINEILACVYMY